MRLWIPCLILAASVALLPDGAWAEDGYQLLELDGHLMKWGPEKLGTGATVSYAFITQAMSFADARNCRDMIPIDGLVAAAGIVPPRFRSEVAAAFAQWSNAVGISFQAVDDPAQAQILIGAQAEPQGRAFTNVAYRKSGDGHIRGLEQSLICLNPTKPWKIGFTGDLEVYDLRYVFTHEIGHAIGLDHPGPSGQLMSFCYEERFREPQPGDLAGAIALYGPTAPRIAQAGEQR
jgi:hypothetical protein